MKICFYGNGIAFTSGNATLVRTLGKYLVKQGHEVTVATRSREEGALLLDGIKYDPILVEKQENLVSYYVGFSIRSLIYFLKNNNYDVLHTMASYHSFAILAKLIGMIAGRPMIYSILSPAHANLRYLGFDKLICTSKSIHHQFRDGVYIPPFIDLNEFTSAGIIYDWKSRAPFVIGTLGTPLYRRGIDVLVKAIPLVLKKYPDTLFVLAINLKQTTYEPRLRAGLDSIRRLIKELDIPAKNIEIVGEVNIPSYFRSLDLFVYPVQTTKGMLDVPPTILECLAGECALITTSLGAVGEVVKDCENGILVNKEHRADPNIFAKNIIKVIDQEHLRNRIRGNARRSVEGFDIQKILPKFIDLYEGVCRK